MAGEEWLCRLIGGISGLLLAVPHIFPVVAPLQFVALIPILYLGATRNVSRRVMLTAGIYMGLTYTLPQMIVLQMPVWITVVLLPYLTVLMIIFAWFSARLLAASNLAGAFAIGALLVVLDWVNFTVIPIWGTAQSFVRPWSRYPTLILFISFTGITGIIFLLGTLQALVVSLILYPKRRAKLFAAAVVVVLVFAAANIIVHHQQPTGDLKVAAVGWISDDSSKNSDTFSLDELDTLFEQLVARAAGEGAQLIVSPEMGFYSVYSDREEWLERFRDIARRHRVFLAIGYFSNREQENRLMFMTPEGVVAAEYTKTYLTPFEDYRRGDGHLAIIDVRGVRVGGMICQDDNFTHLSRGYGCKSVSVVAVPTLDWLTVKSVHFQNSIHRAIESRYAIVRASIDGISAIVSPKGQVIASWDHLVNGPGVVVAKVPVYAQRTIFSIFGHWPMAASFMFLIIYILGHFVKTRFQ